MSYVINMWCCAKNSSITIAIAKCLTFFYRKVYLLLQNCKSEVEEVKTDTKRTVPQNGGLSGETGWSIAMT